MDIKNLNRKNFIREIFFIGSRIEQSKLLEAKMYINCFDVDYLMNAREYIAVGCQGALLAINKEYQDIIDLAIEKYRLSLFKTITEYTGDTYLVNEHNASSFEIIQDNKEKIFELNINDDFKYLPILTNIICDKIYEKNTPAVLLKYSEDKKIMLVKIGDFEMYSTSSKISREISIIVNKLNQEFNNKQKEIKKRQLRIEGF